jgi:hypothetical protein
VDGFIQDASPLGDVTHKTIALAEAATYFALVTHQHIYWKGRLYLRANRYCGLPTQLLYASHDDKHVHIGIYVGLPIGV